MASINFADISTKDKDYDSKINKHYFEEQCGILDGFKKQLIEQAFNVSSIETKSKALEILSQFKVHYGHKLELVVKRHEQKLNAFKGQVTVFMDKQDRNTELVLLEANKNSQLVDKKVDNQVENAHNDELYEKEVFKNKLMEEKQVLSLTAASNHKEVFDSVYRLLNDYSRAMASKEKDYLALRDKNNAIIEGTIVAEQRVTKLKTLLEEQEAIEESLSENVKSVDFLQKKDSLVQRQSYLENSCQFKEKYKLKMAEFEKLSQSSQSAIEQLEMIKDQLLKSKKLQNTKKDCSGTAVDALIALKKKLLIENKDLLTMVQNKISNQTLTGEHSTSYLKINFK